MTKQVNLTIDQIKISVPDGTTILKAAQSAGVHIPTICFHDYCTANALCRICVVEVEGARTLIPACVARVADAMQVYTNSERVRRARRTILEMLVSSVDLSDAPDILSMLQEYQVNTNRFPKSEERKPPVIDDNPMYIRDYAKCILCWRCVQVCATDAQFTFAINFSGRGYRTQIGTFYDKSMTETTCVFCGQCVGVCPTGALKPKKQWLLEQNLTPLEIVQLTRFERAENSRRK